MRRIARTIAASIVVILGLALMSAAALSTDIVDAALPEAPESAAKGGAIKPLNPNADNPPVRKVGPDAPSIFTTEFGKRGKHEVKVTISGGAHYVITWRDDPVSEEGRGNVQRSRTIDSGFPVVQVGMTGTSGYHSTCIIVVDGTEKDRQSTSDETPVQICAA